MGGQFWKARAQSVDSPRVTDPKSQAHTWALSAAASSLNAACDALAARDAALSPLPPPAAAGAALLLPASARTPAPTAAAIVSARVM